MSNEMPSLNKCYPNIEKPWLIRLKSIQGLFYNYDLESGEITNTTRK